MENFGFKGLLVTLYQRVILSYKSTLIGIAFSVGSETLAYLAAINMPSWAHGLVIGIGTIFALIKERYGATPLVPAAPRGFARLAIAGPLAALLALASLLSGCPHMPPVVVDVLHCGEDAIVKRVQDLTTQIVAILRAGGAGWQTALLLLIDAAGEAGACAWEVVYAQIVGGLSLTDRPRDAVPADVQARAAEFQALLEARASSARAGR